MVSIAPGSSSGFGSGVSVKASGLLQLPEALNSFPELMILRGSNPGHADYRKKKKKRKNFNCLLVKRNISSFYIIIQLLVGYITG